MTSARLRLAENLSRVMTAKGINNQRLSDLCRENGDVLHKTTIKNILEGKQWQSDSLEKLERALGVDAANLLAAGDEKSEETVRSQHTLMVNKEDIRWAYKRVDLMLDELKIDDLEYRADVFFDFIAAAATDGIDQAQSAFLRKLAGDRFSG